MMSVFASLSEADRYVVLRLAAATHKPAEQLAALPSVELDKLIPGARAAYERRGEIAGELLRRLGIDPTSAEYRAAASEARRILDQIDQLDCGPAA
jgi:hypothetical protein